MRFSELVLTLRERIEPRLIYSPFLRLIVFNVWFQIGFAAVVLTLIGAALYLPKIWLVSPPGFEPIVKISGLDMTQDWALKRSARKFEAVGDFPRAADSWQGAIGQNPADISALRGFFESCMHIPARANKLKASVVPEMQWLIRINGTNMTDLELVGRLCDRYDWPDIGGYFLSLARQELSPGAEAIMIKALFQQGRAVEFSERLKKRGAELKDPELPLYQLAYAAGWGDTGSAEALGQLEKAAESGENADRAGRLLLRAAAQRHRVDVYARELDRLAARNEANAADHAWYWVLLASTGRTNEAVNLAKSVSVTPASAQELIRVAQSFAALGLLDNAEDLLKRQAEAFGRVPEVWVAYAAILEARQGWEEMRRIGRMIRQDAGLRESAWGLGYFLEGRADLAQKRDASAKVAFERAAESAYDYESVGAVVGRELTRLDYPKLALEVLRKIEPRFTNNLEYWNAVFAASYAAQDLAALLKSTENEFRLNPKDPIALNHYAAALLLNRTRPDEAIELTLQLYSRYPQSTTAGINHACALLLNNRAEEARKLLESLDVRAMSTIERSPYYLSLFEAYHTLKLWDRAWKARESIVESGLFQEQRDWLHEKEKEMPKRLG